MSMTKKIIAIGGGEIGRPGTKVETLAIDKEIIKLSDKNNPRLLFIPTASSDSDGYCQNIEKHFGKKLGCQVDFLYLIKEKPSEKMIKEKISKADIIYVGGGNTLKMMNTWRRYGVDRLLVNAYEKGKVMSGLSAGSICWFKYGNSDSRKFKNSEASLIKVKGLGIIDALHCPHYDAEACRESDLKIMMKKTSGVAIAIDNCCAIEIVDNSYRIIASKPTASAYKVYWKSGKYTKETIKKERRFQPLAELLQK